MPTDQIAFWRVRLLLLLDRNLVRDLVSLISQINVCQTARHQFTIVLFLHGLRAKVRISLGVQRIWRFTKLVSFPLLKLLPQIAWIVGVWSICGWRVCVRYIWAQTSILLLDVNAESASTITQRQICRVLFNLTGHILAKSLLCWVQSRSNEIPFNFHSFECRNFTVRKLLLVADLLLLFDHLWRSPLYCFFEFVLTWCSHAHIFKGCRVRFAMIRLHLQRL